MEVKATHKSARISAQKTRLVADQIRGLPIARAMHILNFSPKKAAFIVKKVVWQKFISQKESTFYKKTTLDPYIKPNLSRISSKRSN